MWKNDSIDKVKRKLLKKNIIVIHGEVDSDMAMYIFEALLRLTSRGSPPITLMITSHGGSVGTGLDIYDALRSYGGKITGVVYAYADSMAAVILQACKIRAIVRHATMLVHHISRREISLDILRDTGKVEEVRRNLEEDQKRIYKILMQKTGRKLDEIRAACAKNESINAEEAVEFGLVDEIR